MALPTVLELIHARLADRSSRPGHRNDPYTLAVVAEDGSMRWVVAAGFLSRLEAHGIQADLILGTSGGGLAITYYAAGHTRHGSLSLRYLNKKGYDRDGKSKKFIDATRLLKGQPAMDGVGMVETVFSQRVPLSFENLARSLTPAYLTATTRAGETVLQPLHGQPPEAIKLAMQNTARVPFLAHSARDKSVLWDGGLKASIPVQQALDLGATHVLVVRCKDSIPATFRQQFNAEELLIKPALRLQAPDLFHLLRQRGHHAAQTLSMLAQNHPHIHVLGLPQVTMSYAEDDEAKLFRQLVEAWHFAGPALGLPEQPLPTEWAPEAAMYL